MKLKNNSARPHWIGDVLIVPGETAEVNDMWEGAYNTAELEKLDSPQQEEKKKPGRPAKADKEVE